MGIPLIDSSSNFYHLRSRFNQRSEDVGDLDFLNATLPDSDLVQAINSLLSDLSSIQGGVKVYSSDGILLNP